MYKEKKILGVITARGGSKGIPGKNIKSLCGKPLIVYTLEAAQGSKYLTQTIISTDNQDIADVAKKYGGNVPFLRPEELATDGSSSMSVIQHLLQKLKESRETYDFLMILQPTSPLRTSKDIDECIKLIVDTNADSVMSMVQITDFSAKKNKKIKEGVILPFFEAEGPQSGRRQDENPAYIRNCAIYLTKTQLIENGDLFGKISRAYVMPQERSIDINNPVDFELAEFWVNKFISK